LNLAPFFHAQFLEPAGGITADSATGASTDLTTTALCWELASPGTITGSKTLTTLNPQPSTLNPQPSTLNPQPSTLNLQPSTPNPQPSTLKHKPLIPQILHPFPPLCLLLLRGRSCHRRVEDLADFHRSEASTLHRQPRGHHPQAYSDSRRHKNFTRCNIHVYTACTIHIYTIIRNTQYMVHYG
jgi:hypothetical protein